MAALFYVLIALFGVVAGGILASASYALPRGEYRQILAPSCASCGKKLPLKYSIPVVGSFLTRFRCPSCGEKQGTKRLISEVIFAVVCVLLHLYYGFSYLFFLYVVSAGLLLLLSLIDLDIKEVPHSLLFAVLALGVMVFVFSFFSFSLSGTVWWEHVVGAFVISLPLFILMMLTGGVGGGDIKLMFCLGLLLGFKLTVLSFFFGIIVAAVTAVALRIACGKGGKYQLPLVPFLSLGAVVALLWGNALLTAIF